MTSSDHNNPALAVDAIITYEGKLVLVYRDNYPEGWAIPGGFVETGETVEDAIRREIKEETNLDLSNLHQWKVFSDPDRDPRQHVVSLCFVAEGVGELKSGSDARETRLVPTDSPWPDMAFDHAYILDSYVSEFRN